MASSYPGGIDSLTNPAPSDSMAVVLHSSQHADANDAIEAIETELGTNPSGASASVKDRLDTLAVGPGSATDNALVRFDGTDGKTVQNSGITVDDSNNITSNLTVSKASARFEATGSGTTYVIATSTSAAAYMLADTPAGQTNGLRYQTGGVLRWLVSKNATAESGSNAGSDWALVAYDDAGASLGTRLSVNRSTGKTTLGAVGATAGLELGASGPRIMSGTGSPEGVVSAPVGSTYIDTAATTGAIKWAKASGTGNTGWVVEYGDTGWRLCVVADTTVFTNATYNSANPNSFVYVRRAGSRVEWKFYAGSSPTFATNYANIFTMPTGFRPLSFTSPGNGTTGPWVTLFDGSGGTITTRTLYQSSSTAGVWVSAGTWQSGVAYMGTATYSTTDAWPTSLPGSAA